MNIFWLWRAGWWSIFWEVVGSGGCTLACGGVGSGGYILAGGGWWWVVVDGGGSWWMVVGGGIVYSNPN